MTDLTPLIQRVEAASGADRELDALIQAALRVQSPSLTAKWLEGWAGPWAAGGDRVFLILEDGRRGPNFISMPLSASVDSALFLMERVLPGWDYCLSRGSGEPPMAALAPRHQVAEVEASAATLPLAILSALLRALQAQQEGGEDV